MLINQAIRDIIDIAFKAEPKETEYYLARILSELGHKLSVLEDEFYFLDETKNGSESEEIAYQHYKQEIKELCGSFII